MPLDALAVPDLGVAGRLLGLLALLGLGIAARASGLLTDPRTDRLNALAYYVALPALVFVSTFDRPLGQLISPGLLVGLWTVVFLTAALAWFVHTHRDIGARRGIAIVQSYHTNVGFLGLPLVAATFGGDVTAIASVVLGIVALTQVPLTVTLLVGLTDADASVRDEIGRIARNPVIWSLLAGFAVSSIGVGIPAPAVTGLGVLADLALPAALLCVGASLPLDIPTLDPGSTGAIVAVKICCMPVLAWLVFTALGVSPATFVAAVVMLAMPTSVSTFVYATELGGDPQFASVNIFATTLASLGTLSVVLTVI